MVAEGAMMVTSGCIKRGGGSDGWWSRAGSPLREHDPPHFALNGRGRGTDLGA